MPSRAIDRLPVGRGDFAVGVLSRQEFMESERDRYEDCDGYEECEHASDEAKASDFRFERLLRLCYHEYTREGRAFLLYLLVG